MRNRQVSLGLLIVLLLACGSDPDHDILHQASDIHNEAVKIEGEIKDQIESLSRLKAMLEKKEGLLPEDSSMIQRIRDIERSHQWWQDNHVEVPGFGHDGHDHSGHDHSGHDHDHDHGPQLEVTASDMLLLQKEFRDSILSVRDRVNALKDR
ncbi:MAG: hypothetical protein KTR24_01585 [Saprospiraceae bacterium]|nr:hypothetical protein [Saprospiraceae bacterium]